MSDARRFEIDAAIAGAVRHFAGACAIFAKMAATAVGEDRYLVEMAFLHAMLAGHTSPETALLRILDLVGEEAPTGRSWHADLIMRAAHADLIMRAAHADLIMRAAHADLIMRAARADLIVRAAHADLITRSAHSVGARPMILAGEAARAADETRQARGISAHAYDAFDHTKAARTVEGATRLAKLLPSEIAGFRRATDP